MKAYSLLGICQDDMGKHHHRHSRKKHYPEYVCPEFCKKKKYKKGKAAFETNDFEEESQKRKFFGIDLVNFLSGESRKCEKAHKPCESNTEESLHDDFKNICKTISNILHPLGM